MGAKSGAKSVTAGAKGTKAGAKFEKGQWFVQGAEGVKSAKVNAKVQRMRRMQRI